MRGHAAFLGLICATLIIVSAAQAQVTAPRPVRIVSLNPCLDVTLVELVSEDRIAALSHYARDAYGSSVDQALAARVPITYETAEEIMALMPDLVLTSRHSSLATRNALSRMHIHTELFDVPDTIDGSIADIRRMASLVGEVDQGEALVTRINDALSNLSQARDQRLTALIFQPNGFSPGAGTMANDLLERGGFENATTRLGLKRWGNMPLEWLLADPPRVLLSGAHQGGASFAQKLLVHPALRALEPRMTRARYDQKLLYCGGPVIIAASRALAEAYVQASTGAAR